MAVNSEMVAAVSPQGEISIAPALRVLPSGQYALRVSADGASGRGNPARPSNRWIGRLRRR